MSNDVVKHQNLDQLSISYPYFLGVLKLVESQSKDSNTENMRRFNFKVKLVLQAASDLNAIYQGFEDITGYGVPVDKIRNIIDDLTTIAKVIEPALDHRKGGDTELYDLDMAIQGAFSLLYGIIDSLNEALPTTLKEVA